MPAYQKEMSPLVGWGMVASLLCCEGRSFNLIFKLTY